MTRTTSLEAALFPAWVADPVDPGDGDGDGRSAVDRGSGGQGERPEGAAHQGEETHDRAR